MKNGLPLCEIYAATLADILEKDATLRQERAGLTDIARDLSLCVIGERELYDAAESGALALASGLPELIAVVRTELQDRLARLEELLVANIDEDAPFISPGAALAELRELSTETRELSQGWREFAVWATSELDRTRLQAEEKISRLEAILDGRPWRDASFARIAEVRLQTLQLQPEYGSVATPDGVRRATEAAIRTRINRLQCEYRLALGLEATAKKADELERQGTDLLRRYYIKAGILRKVTISTRLRQSTNAFVRGVEGARRAIDLYRKELVEIATPGALEAHNRKLKEIETDIHSLAEVLIRIETDFERIRGFIRRFLTYSSAFLLIGSLVFFVAWSKFWRMALGQQEPDRAASQGLPAQEPFRGELGPLVASGRLGAILPVKLTDEVILELAWCPPGDFVMGSPPSEIGRGTYEDQVSVTLSRGFWLGKTEVTQAQWEAIMGSNPSTFKGTDLPVENVSWDEAMRFVEGINQAGLLPAEWKFTLPTDAQWEFACRAGTQGPYAGPLNEMGWYADNAGGRTHSVGRKRPNRAGLFDMHGNVWEWCRDSWDGGAKFTGGMDPLGMVGSYRVCRGGGWSDTVDFCRSASRFGSLPGGRNHILGFRVAVSSTP